MMLGHSVGDKGQRKTVPEEQIEQLDKRWDWSRSVGDQSFFRE